MLFDTYTRKNLDEDVTFIEILGGEVELLK